MTRTLTAMALALTALASQATAFDITQMSDAERSAFRAEVRAFLMENPEVIMEAVAELEKRQADAQARGDADMVQINAKDIFDDGYSWVGGNPDGDITLVEFIDYRCGYCRKAHDEVQELVGTDGKIRFIVKEFPILGEESVLASRFAIAVQQVAGADAYKRVHDRLITFKGTMGNEAFTRIATEEGLDAKAILARMDAPEVSGVIASNHSLAGRLSINGTPTFVLDDSLLRGYMPLDAMTQMVADARAK